MCEPRQVCTAATWRGLRTSLMSKTRTPRKRSLLTGASTPPVPQSTPAARLLDRHDQQVAVDRDVALPARADHRGDEARVLRILDVVGIEAVEVAGEEVLALERQVGVGEVQPARSRGRRRSWPAWRSPADRPRSSGRCGPFPAASGRRPACADRRSPAASAARRRAPGATPPCRRRAGLASDRPAGRQVWPAAR